MTAKLTWDVFVGPPAPLAGDEAGPGQMERTWSPISATLISGEHDAVLESAQRHLAAGAQKHCRSNPGASPMRTTASDEHDRIAMVTREQKESR